MIEVHVEWRPIVGAPGYEVSNVGDVASWLPMRNFAKPPDTRRKLKPSFDKDGYRKFAIRIAGKRVDKRGCVLVAECWHGQRPRGCVVRHKDGSKDNDNQLNLQWGTPLENSGDSKLHGTWAHGEKVNTAILTPEIVRAVRASELSHTALAKQHGVTVGAIWHIRANRSWKHVT